MKQVSKDWSFRIHPAIGVARVGSSDEFYYAPETVPGAQESKKTGLIGGYPARCRR